jgi:hypothetical protein
MIYVAKLPSDTVNIQPVPTTGTYQQKGKRVEFVVDIKGIVRYFQVEEMQKTQILE